MTRPSSTPARALALTLGLVPALAACGREGGEGASTLTGSVTVDGSSTVAPISEAAAEEFVTATAERLREDSCAEQYSDAPFAKAQHALPDTSIHSAAGAARL